MVVAFSESDKGSKRKTIGAYERVGVEGAKIYQRGMLQWLSKVVMLAKKYCPIDTGTLARTIRIVTQAPSGGFYEVTRDPLKNRISVTALITAGGWLINPKTGSICDYAQIVHDGGPTSRGAGYRMGTPFLTMAIDEAEPELQYHINRIGNKWEEEWRSDK